MDLAELLGLPSLDRFIERYFLQVPLAVPGGCASQLSRFGWEAACDVVQRAEADVLVTLDGAPLDRVRPSAPHETFAWLDDGCAIRVRHAERNSPPLAELAASFHMAFGDPVDCHVYLTGAQSLGLSWHYDAEDVFVLQIDGVKEWLLRKNTVNPWPLPDMVPADQQFERERTAVMQCQLAPGDWLYIPSGYWHQTRALERSLSLSIGLLPTTAIDLLDHVRRELLSDLRWRQRLPCRLGNACPQAIDDYTNELIQGLIRDLAHRLAAPDLLERLRRSRCVEGDLPLLPVR